MKSLSSTGSRCVALDCLPVVGSSGAGPQLGSGAGQCPRPGAAPMCCLPLALFVCPLLVPPCCAGGGGAGGALPRREPAADQG